MSKVGQTSIALKRIGCFSVFHLDAICKALRELFRMALVSFVTFVCTFEDNGQLQNSKNFQRDFTFILNVLSESRIHFFLVFIVLAKKNVVSFTKNIRKLR